MVSQIIGAAGVAGFDGFLYETMLSKKFIRAFRRRSILDRITTKEHTAQLHEGGERVDITILPDPVIETYIKGDSMDFPEVEATKVTLEIKSRKKWSVPMYHTDRRLAQNKDFWDNVAKNGSIRSVEVVEEEFFDDIIEDVHEDNSGTTAGANTHAYNLGTSAAPIDVATEAETGVIRVSTAILRGMGALGEQDADTEGGVNIIMPTILGQMYKDSDRLGSATVMGDGVSPLRNGNLKMVDGASIFISNRLPSVDGAVPIIFLHDSAAIFYTNFTEIRKIQHPKDMFADVVGGLQISSWLVHRPKGMAVMWVNATGI